MGSNPLGTLGLAPLRIALENPIFGKPVPGGPTAITVRTQRCTPAETVSQLPFGFRIPRRDSATPAVAYHCSVKRIDVINKSLESRIRATRVGTVNVHVHCSTLRSTPSIRHEFEANEANVWVGRGDARDRGDSLLSLEREGWTLEGG